MKYTIFIPDRYNEHKYTIQNIYHIYPDHISLMLVGRLSRKVNQTLLIDKDDFIRTSNHHWTASGSHRPACSRSGKAQITIGQFISKSGFRVCGKVKGKPLYDFRKSKYVATGNVYTALDAQRMKLTVYRRKSKPYHVVFDKEDHQLMEPFEWRVEKDKSGKYTVITKKNKQQLSLHIYLLEEHGHKSGHKGFRNLEPKRRSFDFRKEILRNHALNNYTIINSKVMELTIHSVHGAVKIIFDKAEYERVTQVTWTYKKNGTRWVIYNSKYGSLKRFLLGKEGERYHYIKEKTDRLGRLDYRKKILVRDPNKLFS